MDLQPLHSTKDTQSKGAELHEPRTAEYEEYEDCIVGCVCFIDRYLDVCFIDKSLVRASFHAPCCCYLRPGTAGPSAEFALRVVAPMVLAWCKRVASSWARSCWFSRRKDAKTAKFLSCAAATVAAAA